MIEEEKGCDDCEVLRQRVEDFYHYINNTSLILSNIANSLSDSFMREHLVAEHSVIDMIQKKFKDLFRNYVKEKK